MVDLGMSIRPFGKMVQLKNPFGILKNHNILNWKLVIKILYNMSDGLYAIHSENYHHKDFHSGNILTEIYGNHDIGSVISDFGMCRPANQSSADKVLYGVLPFIAPEV